MKEFKRWQLWISLIGLGSGGAYVLLLIAAILLGGGILLSDIPFLIGLVFGALLGLHFFTIIPITLIYSKIKKNKD